MKCRIEGCPNEVWPAWNTLCRECQAEIDYDPRDDADMDLIEETEDYEERMEAHGK